METANSLVEGMIDATATKLTQVPELTPGCGYLMDKPGDGLSPGDSGDVPGLLSDLVEVEQGLEVMIGNMSRDDLGSELQEDLSYALHHLKAAHYLLEELQ